MNAGEALREGRKASLLFLPAHPELQVQASGPLWRHFSSEQQAVQPSLRDRGGHHMPCIWSAMRLRPKGDATLAPVSVEMTSTAKSIRGVTRYRRCTQALARDLLRRYQHDFRLNKTRTRSLPLTQCSAGLTALNLGMSRVKPYLFFKHI